MSANETLEAEHPLKELFPEKPAQAFLTYLLGSEPEKAKCMLLEGFDINARSESGWTLLEFSMAAEEFDIFSSLLELGAGINNSPAEMDGLTPLMLATGRKDPAWLRRCLEAGAEVDQVSRDGDTALILAAAAGQRELVSILLEAGASINLQGYHRTTALHEAVKNGDAELVGILLSLGADPTLEDEYGDSAENLMPEYLDRNLASFNA
jgi:ankyrin repeat protein